MKMTPNNAALVGVNNPRPGFTGGNPAKDYQGRMPPPAAFQRPLQQAAARSAQQPMARNHMVRPGAQQQAGRPALNQRTLMLANALMGKR